MDEIIEIPLEDVYWTDSTDVTEEQICDMAMSIMIHGQIEPIVVCPHDEKGYRGVVGRLRYEGMKYRWRNEPEGKTILARIHEFKDEIEIKMWQLAENLHRREVAPMQRARQIRALHDLLRKESGEEATVQSLASTIEDATGNKQSLKTIHHYLSLTKLEPETQEILTREKMPLRHGLELLRVKDPKKQVEMAKRSAEEKLDLSDLKVEVDLILEAERREKRKKQLEKKAEELRAEGVTVYIEAPYGEPPSWDKFSFLWGEIPEKCKNCPKKGILLKGNFQQQPICTDPKCHEKLVEERERQAEAEQERKNRLFNEERAKVYSMEPDVRHWRIAVYGLIDSWELGRILKSPPSGDEELWDAVKNLTEEECKKILIRRAVEQILTPPTYWSDSAKTWIVEEFKLKRELFLGDT